MTDQMILDLVAGKSLYNPTSKDTTLDELESTAKFIDSISKPVFLPASQISYHGNKDDHHLVLAGNEVNVTTYALKKMLSLLKIPYGFFIDNLPEKTRRNVLEDMVQASGRIFNFQTLDVDGVPLVRGVSATNKAVVSDSAYIGQLKQFVNSVSQAVDVIHPTYTIDGFSFRVVFPREEFVITKEQTFSPGFHVQHSVTGLYPTTASPFLLNWFCYNGCIDLAAQKDILKQKSISVPAEALNYVFQSVYDWLMTGDAPTMFKAMKAIYDSQMEVSRRDAEKLMKDFTRGLTINYTEMLSQNLFHSLPADPKHMLNAYTFYNDVTNKAQAFEPWAKNIVEANVTEYTNTLFTRGKVPAPVTIPVVAETVAPAKAKAKAAK